MGVAMTSILAFLIGVLVLVSVHEWGHYRVAKACGVGVIRFSIGFGKPIWRWKFAGNDTEFVLARWPLGGYVRMVDESEGQVPPHLLPTAFNRQRLSVRAAVVAAGPLVNLLFAFVLYAAVQWLGQSQAQPVVATPPAESLAAQAGVRAGEWVRDWRIEGDTSETPIASIEQLRWQLARALAQGDDAILGVSDSAQGPVRHVHLPLSSLRDAESQPWASVGLGMAWMPPVVREVLADGAGARAGLQAGDEVLRIDGSPVDDVQALRERIQGSVAPDGQVTTQRWVLRRLGQTLELDVAADVVREANQSPIGRLGVMLGEAPAQVFVQATFFDGLQAAMFQTWEVAALSVQTFWRMITGGASWANISGPVGVAQVAGSSASIGVVAFLQFLAFFSVNLAVLNLLPVPLLDGGHLMYYLWEWASGKPVSEAHLRHAQRVGMLLLGALMAVALSNDLMRLMN